MLTPKQENFCRAIAEGYNQCDAYRIAYNVDEKTKAATVNNKAYVLCSRDDIRARVEELKAETTKRWLWTREDSIRTLKQVIDEGKANDRVAAVKELNAMHGFQEAKKIDLNASGMNFNFNLGDK